MIYYYIRVYSLFSPATVSMFQDQSLYMMSNKDVNLFATDENRSISSKLVVGE